MADLLRLVTLSPGGRPVEVLNLQNGVGYVLKRDSFTITPAASKARSATLTQRYGGSRVVGESHDNGTIGWTVKVKGTSNSDALQKIGDLLQSVEMDGVDLYIEWRIENAAQSTLFEVRGPGNWIPHYAWVQFSQNNSIEIDVTFPVGPKAFGLPMDILDPFDVDSIADYTIDVGAGTLSVAGGLLVPSSTAEKMVRHTGRGYDYGDGCWTFKITPSTTGLQTARVTFTDLDAANHLFAGYLAGALAIGKRDAGADTTLATTSPTTFAPSAGVPYWLRVYKAGNAILVERFTTAPVPGAAAASNLAFTLTGGDITKYGVGKNGDVGFRWTPVATADRFDELRVEPFTYKAAPAVTAACLTLDGPIPGTAPARCALRVVRPDAVAYPFLAAGWAPIRAGAADAPVGMLQPADVDLITNLTSGAATTSGWTAQTALKDATVSGAETYVAGWNIDPTRCDHDEFNSDLMTEVFVLIAMSSTIVTPRLSAALVGQAVGAPSQPSEPYGVGGRIVQVPSALRARWYKVGYVRYSTKNAPVTQLQITALMGPGSTGVFELMKVMQLPARQRLSLPTGKTADTTYPAALPGTTLAVDREYSSDLKGSLGWSDESQPRQPGSSAGGSIIDVQPSAANISPTLELMMAEVPPDDPVSSSIAVLPVTLGRVHLAVQPAYHLLRDG